MRTILKYFFEKDTKKHNKLITFLDFFWNQLKKFIKDTSYDKIYKIIIKCYNDYYITSQKFVKVYSYSI